MVYITLPENAVFVFYTHKKHRDTQNRYHDIFLSAFYIPYCIAERNYFNADKDLKFKTCVALFRKAARCRIHRQRAFLRLFCKSISSHKQNFSACIITNCKVERFIKFELYRLRQKCRTAHTD